MTLYRVTDCAYNRCVEDQYSIHAIGKLYLRYHDYFVCERITLLELYEELIATN